MHRRRYRVRLAAAVAAGGLVLHAGIAWADSLVLTGGTVIDGTGKPPMVGATVLV